LRPAFAAFETKSFRWFVTGRLLLVMGFQIQYLVLGWLIYDLTHDPLQLGLAGLAEIIPFLSVIWLSGPLADRFNRKKIIILTNCLFLVGYTFIGISIHQAGPEQKSLVLFLYYSMIILVGFTRGFFGPSSQAIVPTLVPTEHFANATTWNTSVFHLASVVGPALGGLLYAAGGKEYTFLIVFAFLLIGLFCMLMMHYPGNQPNAQQKRLPIFQQLKTGIKFVFSNQVIIGSLTLDLFAVLFGGAVALLPVFAADVLKCGPEGLGLLRSAPASGALLMAWFLVMVPPEKNAGKALLLSVAGFGLCMIGFALSTNFFLSLLLLFMSGALDNISVVIRQTVVQMRTPDHMRGSVAAVNSIFIGMSNEIGAFESGLAAKLLGLIPSVIIGGLVTIGVVGATAKYAPDLRNLNLKEFQ
jgi:MFS family permease